MGFLDELKKLTHPYDDDDDDFIDEDDAPPARPASRVKAAPVEDDFDQPRRPAPRSSAFSSSYGSDFSASAPSSATSGASVRGNKVVNISATTQVQVVLVKPERFESAAEIADHLREKRTVVMNLEQTGKDIARRLIDFLSGVAYAQDGKIKKVANSTYLITPYNVDLMGDVIDELESNGMYF